MGKKTYKDILSLLKTLQTFIKNKPDTNKMYEDVRMMKFKIKPIQGDFSLADMKDKKFVEALWSLGKLDELYHAEYPRLARKDRKTFIRIIDDLYHKYQQDLNRASVYKGFSKENSVLEMEIFKEIKRKKIN